MGEKIIKAYDICNNESNLSTLNGYRYGASCTLKLYDITIRGYPPSIDNYL